jgi:phage FluMu protein Com
MSHIKCTQCNGTFARYGTVEDISICPECGSTSLVHEIIIEDSAKGHEKGMIKGKHGGSGRPFRESTFGDDLHRKTGRWMDLERVIDRDNDKYKERIVNPETGKVIHECEEPLSKHQGYGSAKAHKDPEEEKKP